MLRRLKERFRNCGPGWGWVTITGARGAGVTRVLDEAEDLLRSQGGPPPLCVRPVADAVLPMEPLRRVLRPLFPARAPRALERALSAALASAPDDLALLASWLLGGEGAWHQGGLERALVRDLLGRVAGGGPVLVDDADRLDDDTLDVLLPTAHGQGPGVVAGVADTSPLASGGEVLALEPLGETQVELLLRRWLRHPATAKRLAPHLLETCGGWPGRVVEAVRTMARAGTLRMEPRGVVVVGQPDRWPDGRRSRHAFEEWVHAQGGRTRRLVELASVQGAPDDPALLAETAGVSPAHVRAVIAEAVGARGGCEPGLLFASDKEREAFRQRLTPIRCRRLAARLAATWDRRASTPQSADEAARQLQSYTRARRDDALPAALACVLAHGCEPLRLDGRALDAITEAALRLVDRPPGNDTAPLGLALDRLWRAGRREAVARIADTWTPPEHPTSLPELLTRARHAVHRGRPFDGRALLEEHLSTFAADLPDADAFDAWILLARLRLIGRQVPAARVALRDAGRSLPLDDLERRATWHSTLAALARLTPRQRAVRAHLHRAAYLQVAAGDGRAAAEGLRELGTWDVERGDVTSGLRALRRAARLHRFLADGGGRARALYQIGRVLARHGSFDAAAERLHAALAAAEGGRLTALLPQLHLALAAAHRGCGDLARERHHAELAASLATDALDRVRAANVLAQADLRAGLPAAERLLEACQRDLRAAGLTEEAGRAQAALFDARLRAGAPTQAARALGAQLIGPHARLGAARLALSAGDHAEARRVLEGLLGDADLAADLRAAASAYLAEAHGRIGRMRRAKQAAVSAAALLEVPHRSRADDARLHRILARVFRRLGEHGRAVSHRRAARRRMRALVRGEADPRARLRLVRSFWRRDPAPPRSELRAAS